MLHQRRPERSPPLIIEAQEHSSRAPDWGERLNHRHVQVNVLAPTIDSRVEQRSQRVGLRVECSDIRPFETVTAEAGICQVVEIRAPTVLFPDDTIGLMGRKRRIFWDTTVLVASAVTSRRIAAEI